MDIHKSAFQKILRILGISLIFIGGVVFIFGQSFLMRLPSSFSVDIGLTGSVSLLESISLDVLPAEISATMKIDTISQQSDKREIKKILSFEEQTVSGSKTGDKILEILLAKSQLSDSFKDALLLVLGKHDQTDEFWIDAKTGKYITPDKARGTQFFLPMGEVDGNEFEIYDSISGKQITMNRFDERDQDGVDLVGFEGDFGVYNIGTIEFQKLFDTKVRIDASVHVVAYFDKSTGMLVDGQVEGVGISNSGPFSVEIFSINIGLSDDSTSKFLKTVRKIHTGVWWIHCISSIMIVFGGYFIYRSINRKKPPNRRVIRQKR